MPADDRTRVADQYDLVLGTGHSPVGDQAKAREIRQVLETHLVPYILGTGYPAGRVLPGAAGRSGPDRVPVPHRRAQAEVLPQGRPGVPIGIAAPVL
jgi:hypothetical protein